MTDQIHSEEARAAVLNARAAALNAEVAVMVAENQFRRDNGESVAFGEDEFRKVLDASGCQRMPSQRDRGAHATWESRMIDWFDRQPKLARFVMRMIGFVIVGITTPIWFPIAIFIFVVGHGVEMLIDEWNAS